MLKPQLEPETTHNSVEIPYTIDALLKFINEHEKINYSHCSSILNEFMTKCLSLLTSYP